MNTTLCRFAAGAVMAALLAVQGVHGIASARADEAAVESTQKTAEKTSRKAAEKADKATEKPQLPVFNLRGPLSETPVDESFPFMADKVTPLKELVARMNKAKDDKSVKAIVLLIENAEFGLAQAEELRQAMDHFRAGGKEIYAFADELTMPKYLVLCGANHVSVVPTGDVWLTGLYGATPYLRGLLDMLGVTPDFLTCGAYKSAAEIFMRKDPSPEANEMQNWLMDSIFESQINLIAAGRQVDAKKVREWIDGAPYTSRRAKELGIIDEVQHREDFQAFLKEKLGDEVKFEHQYGEKSKGDLDLSSPFAVLNLWSEILAGPKKAKAHKDSIAIVYVEGPIVLGEPETSAFGGASRVAASGPLRRALDKAADDDTIKGVVLRVDSPGGSAVASEVILSAAQRVKAKKPLVVSMGNVAASGGYYVSCGTDTILADAATITGSIGVVGGKLATTDMWQKIGINWKSYQRGANAGILSSERTFNKEERQRMQAWMDEIYGVFKQHVVDIRGSKLKKPIDDLAGGRVYTGRQALELGLVDKIGTLEDAIKLTADNAKISKYEVRIMPEPKNFIELLLEDVSGGDDDPKRLSLGSAALGPMADTQPSLLNLAAPYLKKLDPQRLRAVLLALRRLDMLQREGAVLMMPELTFGYR